MVAAMNNQDVLSTCGGNLKAIKRKKNNQQRLKWRKTAALWNNCFLFGDQNATAILHNIYRSVADISTCEVAGKNRSRR